MKRRSLGLQEIEQMKKPGSIFRVLIIEDDPGRAQRLKTWLSGDVRVVVATSVGKAIGVLQRDCESVYAGILLDHDLQQQAATDTDRYLSGTNLVDVIIRNISNDVPVLVHSMNISKALTMTNRLKEAGFSVTQIPMERLTHNKLMEWLDEARSIWQELQNE